MPLALNGRVHSGPNCWTDRSTGDIYHTHYDDFREGYITKTEPDGTTTTSKLSSLAGNPLGLPAADNNHLALVVGQDSDGYVYVAGNMHGHTMRCIRFDTPRAVSGAFTNMASTLTVDSGEVCTYPTFQSTSNGTLILWIRRRVPDASNNIGKWGAWVKAPGQAWTYQGTVVQDMPHDTTQNSSAEDDGDFLAYTGSLFVGPDDVLRICTAWSDWGESLSQTALGYMESADLGATWRNVSGTPITTPLEYADRSSQTLGINPGGSYNEAQHVALDSAGRPAISVYDLSGSTYAVRWNGSTWQSTAVTTPAYTSRSRLVTFRGELWMIGTSNLRVQMVNLETPRTIALGRRVHRSFEPTLDPEALRDGIVRCGFTDLTAATALIGSTGDGPRFKAA